jgi:orotate phosphoribosyltransferase-like protein
MKTKKHTDKITIEISCTSETCEELREQGLFFEAIADVLDISREDIQEIDNDKG